MQQVLEWCDSCWPLDYNLVCQVWILPKHTNAHILFLAFRWGGPCVSLHYNIVVSAGGSMAAGPHSPSASTRLKKKGGSGGTRIVMKMSNIVFQTDTKVWMTLSLTLWKLEKSLCILIMHRELTRDHENTVFWDQSHRRITWSLTLTRIWRQKSKPGMRCFSENTAKI